MSKTSNSGFPGYNNILKLYSLNEYIQSMKSTIRTKHMNTYGMTSLSKNEYSKEAGKEFPAFA